MGLIDADMIRPGSISYGLTRFSGAPIPVGIIDSGAALGAGGHVDFATKRACGYDFTSEALGAYVDELGHGTHVLGTIAGTGSANPRFTGAAPGVGEAASGGSVRVAKIWAANDDGTIESSTEWLESAIDWMVTPLVCGDQLAPLVINHSGTIPGSPSTGTDSTSRKIDYRTYINRQLYVISSGNIGPKSGTVRAPGVAKNALSVGNVIDQSHYEQMGDIFSTSSRGPTSDGRMKPNVVAPGHWIVSAQAGTTDGYVGNTGTSMAAPHVTALAATLMQHDPQFQFNPALVRAHLMATAMGHDGEVGKSNTYGLGRVSSYVAHWDHPNADGWETRRFSGTVNSAGFAYGDITVPAGAKRLVVALTWDEPPASAGASRAVLYDVDLWIDRDVNCMNPTGACGEYASVSLVDNVEYVVVNDPPPGVYRLKVVPHDASTQILPWGMSAVVIRGDALPAARVASPPAMHANTTGPSGPVVVGETFGVTVNVFNDSYVASGVEVLPPAIPAGVTFLRSEARRLDGVTVPYVYVGSVTFGNIPPSWLRAATWTFRADAPGAKTFTFRARSENSGEVTVTRTVSVVTNADLTVTALTTTPPAPALAPGTTFRVTGTVQNAGTAPAGPTKTRYHLSRDAARSADDVQLTRTASVTGLAPGQSRVGTLTVTIPSVTPLDTYYLIACADDTKVVLEIDEENNCVASPAPIVTVTRPDLVESTVSNPPASTARGGKFPVTDTVTNVGGATTSRGSTTRYSLSLDAVKSVGDTLLTGSRSVLTLAAGASATGTITVTVPQATAPGTYFLLACADHANVVVETNEANNCKASATTVTVTP
jgi:hypothetical protein